MNMSFSKSIEAMTLFNKTVTRRYGWNNVYPAQILMAVEKSQGLKLGDRVKPIHEIQIIKNRWEPASMMIENQEYGESEVILEGFPDMSRHEFVDMLCSFNKKRPDELVNRIEFRHLLRAKRTEISINGDTFILEPDRFEYQPDGTLAGLYDEYVEDYEVYNQLLLDTVRFEI